MRKKMMTFVAAAALTLFAAAPAMAGPGVGGGDGACVAAGVQTLGGKGAQAIGDTAKASPAGAVASVILAHTNGLDPLSGACSD